MKVLMYTRTLASTLVFASIASLPSCSDSTVESEVRVLRFSGIPDSNTAQLNARAKVIEKFLGEAVGLRIEFVQSSDYTAACNGVASNKLDLAWLGGVTAVQAEQRSKGEVTLVTCRESDLKFKSYFIANKEAIKAGKIKKVDKLEDAADMLKNCTFTFGSKSSTSGRVMPQHFMSQAGIDHEKGVRDGAKFRMKGGHTATLNAVNDGTVEVGALNYKTFDKARAEAKANAEVIYTTPPYVDYCMVAHKRLGAELIGKIRDAFTSLDPAKPEHKAVLEAFAAKKFVPAKSSDWDQIRSVLKSTKLD